MLTDKELDTYKICEIPTRTALRWLGEILQWGSANKRNVRPGRMTNTGQKCSLGGDIAELFIYKHTDEKYYLIQSPSEESVE